MARRWAGMSWRGVAFGLVMAGVSWTALAGAPSVYPTGTTIFHPDKTWNGYTVFITPDSDGVILIDMNGRVVKQWTGLSGAAGGPATPVRRHVTPSAREAHWNFGSAGWFGNASTWRPVPSNARFGAPSGSTSCDCDSGSPRRTKV